MIDTLELQQDFKNYLDILSLNEEEYLDLIHEADEEMLEEINYLLSLDYSLIVESYFENYIAGDFETFNEAILLEASDDAAYLDYILNNFIANTPEVSSAIPSSLLQSAGSALRSGDIYSIDQQLGKLLPYLSNPNTTATSVLTPETFGALHVGLRDNGLGGAIDFRKIAEINLVKPVEDTIKDVTNNAVTNTVTDKATDAVTNTVTDKATDAVTDATSNTTNGTLLKRIKDWFSAKGGEGAAEGAGEGIKDFLGSNAGKIATGAGTALALYAARKAVKANKAKHRVANDIADYIRSKRKNTFSDKLDTIGWNSDNRDGLTRKVKISGTKKDVNIIRNKDGTYEFAKGTDDSIKNNDNVKKLLADLNINVSNYKNKKNEFYKNRDKSIDDEAALRQYHDAKGIFSRLGSYFSDFRKYRREAINNRESNVIDYVRQKMEERKNKINRGRELFDDFADKNNLGGFSRTFRAGRINRLGSDLQKAIKDPNSQLAKNIDTSTLSGVEEGSDPIILGFSDCSKAVLNESELLALYNHANSILLEI